MRRMMILACMLLLMAGMLTTYAQSNAPDANLHLIVSKEFLVIYVSWPSAISLAGLQFRIVNPQGIFQSFKVEEGFDALRLTDSFAPPGACYAYRLSGTNAPLPSVCAQPSRTFIRDVAEVDVFWYDFTANRKRDIAIMSNGKLTGDVCSASATDCPFNYARAIPTVTRNTDWKPLAKNFDDVEMVLVPPGCFMMGSEEGSFDEKPINEQCLDKPFWIDRTEVTNKQFADFKGKAALTSYWQDEQQPREYINWIEAHDFCMKRSGRLPTEREWEYAARGPDNLKYPWGNEFSPQNAVYAGNSNRRTAKAGGKPDDRSWVAALDMSGNVSEWVSTIYDSDRFPYPYDANDGREATDPTKLYVLRGGSWYTFEDGLKATYRNRNSSSYQVASVGFRCARDFQAGDVSN
jgi:formylglycine-generating enzyme required for sulfatase activity